MQKTHAILKALNELLENKEAYGEEDYKRKLLKLKGEIDQHILLEKNKQTTKKEQELLLQQYRALVKMI